MVKEIIGWSLILLGMFEIGNFVAHHSGTIPSNDGDFHALVGLMMTVCGAYLVKSDIKIRDSWNKFKD